MEAAVRKRPWASTGSGIPDVTGDARLMEPAGAFCTLTIAGNLRGCVGFLEPVHPLVESVARASVKAALEDERFLPVEEPELALIRIELSVLSRKEPVGSLDEVLVGRDGLFLETDSARGLLLPQVAKENGWDAGTFLVHLFNKCGLRPSPIDAPGVRVFLFGAEVFSETGTGTGRTRQ